MASFLFYDDQIINILMKEEKPSGGAAVQAYGWIRGLDELGHEVTIMTNKPGAGELKTENITLNIVSTYDRSAGIRWLRWVYYRIPFLYRRIREIQPDYLYQGVPGWTSYLLGKICRSLGIRFVIRISNDFIVDDRIRQKFSWMYCFLQRQGMKMAYAILCQNDYQLKQVKQQFPGKLVAKISNPVFQQFEGRRTPGPGKYIAWIGIFQYQKNLKLLWEIAKALPEQDFRIAGKEDAKCDDETKRYLEKLHHLPNVRFAGFLGREAVLEFVAGASYLLNTSHYEGFSNTFLEAMSAGTPVITSDKVNPDGIISKHSLGLVYRDVPDLVKKINAVTPDRYDDMTRLTKQYLDRYHDYVRLSARMAGILADGLTIAPYRTDMVIERSPVLISSVLLHKKISRQ